MLTSQDVSPPQLPSYETLQAAQQWVRLTPEAGRLFWTLEAPLTEAVSAMRSEYNPRSGILRTRRRTR
ncbi:hypothetical protein CkaCkLH20_04542 [Colletotrichum karsti]|uniref:Uncharacterized protein n=1 Tax=Colletotrichum karsti TaxID=1095194 RepID=A0A9P6LM91_9PEZI|nr:uncharacterized protein CkaCkLH20_04542 [Colletotrichum karsti]KAF9877966.1 hypothetical protein CkaCkLH20_04542 [Colletotrichum karsti]